VATHTPTFTRREKEVADLLCLVVDDGTGLTRRLTLDEIGERVGIAPGTVRVYCNALRQKLRVRYRKDIPAAYLKATAE